MVIIVPNEMVLEKQVDLEVPYVSKEVSNVVQ